MQFACQIIKARLQTHSKYLTIITVNSSGQHFVAVQQCKGNPLLHFNVTIVNFLYCWQLHLRQQQWQWNVLLRFHGNNGYANVPQCKAVGALYCVRNPSIWLDKPSNIAFEPIIEPRNFPIQSLLQEVWPCAKSCRHFYSAHVATVTPQLPSL
jgi:hypothetical protein